MAVEQRIPRTVGDPDSQVNERKVKGSGERDLHAYIKLHEGLVAVEATWKMSVSLIKCEAAPC